MSIVTHGIVHSVRASSSFTKIRLPGTIGYANVPPSATLQLAKPYYAAPVRQAKLFPPLLTVNLR